MWHLHMLLSQSMVKKTSKNASVYHVLNTKLSVLELKNTSCTFSAFIELIKHLSFRSYHFFNNLSVIIMITFPEKRKAKI